MSRIQKLGQCLVDKYELSEQESEEFVTNLFDIIRESLLTDKLVKVKGLGTFKLTEMNARESVNVNTGERITIEGRYKLSFTPENAVRDRINSPFASFESMDMDDEIDFSEIDQKYENPEAIAVEPVAAVAPLVDTAEVASPLEVSEEPTTVEVPEEPTSIEVSEVVSPSGEGESHSPIEPDSTTPVEPLVDFADEEPVGPLEADSPAPEPLEVETPVSVPVAEVIPPSQPEVEPSESESPSNIVPLSGEGESHSPSQPEEPTPAEVNPAAEQEKATVRAPICEELIQQNMNHNQTIINLLHWLIGLVVLVLICIGGYFIYNVGRDNGAMEYYIHHNDVEDADARAAEQAALQNSGAGNAQEQEDTKPKHDISLVKTPGAKPSVEKPETKPEAKPATPAATKPAATPAKSTSVAASPSGKGDSHSPSQTKTTAAKPATTTAKPTATSAVSESYNNKDARVRTGAYNIVGTQTTVTVREGQTLKSISKFYLGDGMECYIEAYNGGKTTFNAGDKVKIPKLELKKKAKK